MTANSQLDSQVLLRFRVSLQQEQRELQQVIDKADQELRALVDAGPLDAVDLSCSNSFKESMFAHISQIRRQLRLVEYALERTRNGEFGICAMCEDGIDLKRLQAFPWARHCLQCQERFEHVQRRAAMVELYYGNTLQR